MDHDAKAVANAFLKLAKRERVPLTNMQLQKLVYIAHGYCLALLRQPLFRDQVFAWQFGPVVPALYDELKQYGSGQVKKPLYTETPPIEEESPGWKVIRGVWNSYGKYSGPQLSALTHKPNTPWDETRGSGNQKIEIPNPTIARYYRDLLNAGRLKQQAVTEA
jgi:uncharacterized phage-associated protein